MKYWSKKGQHQELYDSLQAALVPDEGFAATDAGEILRCFSNVYYDVFNNGGCNLDVDGGTRSDLHGLFYYLDKFDFNYQTRRRLEEMLNDLAECELPKGQQERLHALLDEAADFIILKAQELTAATA
jgi:hypothetical protein